MEPRAAQADVEAVGRVRARRFGVERADDRSCRLVAERFGALEATWFRRRHLRDEERA